MRKYYDDVNEEYERGFRAGRREAMRMSESFDDLLTFEEVNDIIVKTAKKHGLKATRHSPDDLYSIDIRDVGRLDFYPSMNLDNFKKGDTHINYDVEIKGYFNSGTSLEDFHEFESSVDKINRIVAVWNDLKSINLSFSKKKK